MEIAVFWIVVYGLLWALRLRPNSVVSRAAFTWLGPTPISGEHWSRFQWRWAAYSFGWLCQFAVVLSVLFALVSYFKWVGEETWFSVLLFALPFGIGIAGLAFIGFAFKAVKAHYWGPNPIYEPGQESANAV